MAQNSAPQPGGDSREEAAGGIEHEAPQAGHFPPSFRSRSISQMERVIKCLVPQSSKRRSSSALSELATSCASGDTDSSSRSGTLERLLSFQPRSLLPAYDDLAAASRNPPRQCLQDVWLQASFSVQLKRLIEAHPYLEPSGSAQPHPLQVWVSRCRMYLAAKQFQQAQRHLYRARIGLEAERSLIAEAFRYFDADGSGDLDSAEFRRMCAYLGWDEEDAGVMDLDGDGRVTLVDVEAFIGYMGGTQRFFERRCLRVAGRSDDSSSAAGLFVGDHVWAYHSISGGRRSDRPRLAQVLEVCVPCGGSQELALPRRGPLLQFHLGPDDSWWALESVPPDWVCARVDKADVARGLQQVHTMDERQLFWVMSLPQAEVLAMRGLSGRQKDALRCTRNAASKLHLEALPDLQKRFATLSYGEGELQAVLGWLQDLAPLIIHVNIDKVGHLLEAEEFYHNQPERHGRHSSAGQHHGLADREGCESKLFDRCYDGVEPFERVKYGSLDILNDYRGATGDSYMVLRDVRARTSFTRCGYGDGGARPVGMLDRCAHVLSECDDCEIHHLVTLATASASPEEGSYWSAVGPSQLQLLRGSTADPTLDWITVGFPGLQRKTGKHYFEVRLFKGCIMPQVGVLSSEFVRKAGVSCDQGVGDDKHGWAVSGISPTRWSGGRALAWGTSWPSEAVVDTDATMVDSVALSEDITVGVAVDFKHRSIWFSTNGVWDSSAAFTSSHIRHGTKLYPALSLQGRAAFKFLAAPETPPPKGIGSFELWPGAQLNAVVRVDCPHLGHSSSLFCLQECHVHGQVDLKQNVQRLVVNERYRKNTKSQFPHVLTVSDAGPLSGNYRRKGAHADFPLYRNEKGAAIYWDPSSERWKMSETEADFTNGAFFASAPAIVNPDDSHEIDQFPPRTGWEVHDNTAGIVEAGALRSVLEENDVCSDHLDHILKVLRWDAGGEADDEGSPKFVFWSKGGMSLAEEWKRLPEPPLTPDEIWEAAITKMQRQHLEDTGLSTRAQVVETEHPYPAKRHKWRSRVHIDDAAGLSVYFAKSTCTRDSRSRLRIRAGGLSRSAAGVGARVEIAALGGGKVWGTVTDRVKDDKGECIWHVRLDRRADSEIGSLPLPPIGTIPTPSSPSLGSAKGADSSSQNFKFQPLAFIACMTRSRGKSDEDRVAEPPSPSQSSTPPPPSQTQTARARRCPVGTQKGGLDRLKTIEEGSIEDETEELYTWPEAGDRVEALHANGVWYPATVTAIQTGDVEWQAAEKKSSMYFIEWWDGDNSDYVKEHNQLRRPSEPCPGRMDLEDLPRYGLLGGDECECFATCSEAPRVVLVTYAGASPAGAEIAGFGLSTRHPLTPLSVAGFKAEGPAQSRGVQAGWYLDVAATFLGPSRRRFAELAEGIGGVGFEDIDPEQPQDYDSFNRRLGRLLDAAFNDIEEFQRRLNAALGDMHNVTLVFTNSASQKQVMLLPEAVVTYSHRKTAGDEFSGFMFGGSLRLAQCDEGHELVASVKPFHYCDECYALGTALCCSQGCNYDMCAECHRTFTSSEVIWPRSVVAPGPATKAGVRKDWFLDTERTRARNPGYESEMSEETLRQDPNRLLALPNATLVFRRRGAERALLFESYGPPQNWSCKVKSSEGDADDMMAELERVDILGNSADFEFVCAGETDDAPHQRWGVWALVLPSDEASPGERTVNAVAERWVETAMKAKGFREEIKVDKANWDEARLRALCKQHGWELEWMNEDGERQRRALERKRFFHDASELLGAREVQRFVTRSKDAPKSMSTGSTASTASTASDPNALPRTTSVVARSGSLVRPVNFPDPDPDAITFEDPRDAGNTIGVIGFCYSQREELWDKICGSAFLGNSWDLGAHCITLTANSRMKSFKNAEAAFQALKFWDHADAFADMSGPEALQYSQSLRGQEDWTFSGHGNNWAAMRACLRAKFSQKHVQTRLCQDGLLRTGDAYLLLHHGKPGTGTDKEWSNNHTGNGKNWTGLLLMLLRDELRERAGPSWTSYVQDICGIDLATGGFFNARSRQGAWQASVFGATRALDTHLAQQRQRTSATAHEMAVRADGSCRVPPLCAPPPTDTIRHANPDSGGGKERRDLEDEPAGQQREPGPQDAPRSPAHARKVVNKITPGGAVVPLLPLPLPESLRGHHETTILPH